ncbi:P-loop containing nucleoside triphosphate hydrolase protein, partial [Ramicandelaber brevisporus]
RIEQPEDAHVLKVLLLGAPNAGKSTLLNRLAGREISVASGKAQTTRSQILGAVTRDSTQLIFMDTPGVVPANVRSVVERSVITAPWNALRNDPDHIVIVVDAEYAVRHPVSGSSDSLFGKLAATRQPPRATLLLNKCDLVTADLGEEAAEKVLSQLEKRYASRYPLTDSVMRISAAKGTNIDQLEKHLVSLALPGAWELPAEEATNHSDAWLVAEVVRAEFYEHLHGVVPYRLRVKTVEWDESNGTMRPAAKVVVEVGDPGIKRIVIGQDGKIINSVLARATDRARASLGKAVRIDLKV